MAESNDFAMGYAMGQDSGGGGNNGGGMFNGDAFWGIILLALLFGNNGFGGGFGGGGGFAGQALTRAELYDGFAIQNIDSAVRGVQNGISDSTYALNNAITGGFNGVNSAICNLGFNIQSGINGISREIGDCCCENRAAVADLKYTIGSEFCGLGNTIQSVARDITDNQNAGTRAILDFLTQDKIATLTAENQSLKFAASQAQQNAFITANQEAQTAELIRRLGVGCPTPAYIVQPPTPVNFPTNGCGTVQFGGGGCGCGCGCG